MSRDRRGHGHGHSEQRKAAPPTQRSGRHRAWIG
jgi:hypothetical protein